MAYNDDWRGSYDDWKCTEPDPEPGPRLGQCDRCGDDARQEIFIGVDLLHLCDACAESAVRR